MALNPAFEIKGIIRHAWSWWWKGSNQKLDYARVVFTLLIALAVISLYKWLIKNSKKEKVQLPPGPQGLPLVGNLPFLDPELHRCFAELAGTYGPIMKLRLGCKLCIVITSPSLAREVLKDQDTSFANRDVPAVGFLSSYGGLDIVWSPYGAQWRMQRKICVKEMLNKGRLDALYGLRRREVRAMVSQVYSYKSNPVDIGDQMLLTMFNVITSMLWGGILKGEERNHVTAEFRLVMEKVLGLLGEPNVSDLFPAIAWFDIQGKGRRMKKLMLWFDRLFDSVINRRLRMQDLEGEERNNDKESKDFLQVLLLIKDQGDTEAPFTITHIKALLMDMMAAGTDTTSDTVEWTMTELMNHPEIMRKVQEELREFVGMNDMVEESHLPKLHYLDAVVKEVLRLHPIAPILLPRRPSVSCTVGGYLIPEGATVVVNAWAIQRDPTVWENPLEFRPERFLGDNCEFDYSGNDFRYIPFGSGRRVCVGIPMAERMVPYLLASLLHSFEWKLPEGTKLDLSDKFGLGLKKVTPLIAIPTPRLSDPKLYT